MDQRRDNVEELRQAGQLQRGGRSAEVLPVLQDILATTTDGTIRAYTPVRGFGAPIDPGVAACP